jgi:hypothetical protein
MAEGSNDLQIVGRPRTADPVGGGVKFIVCDQGGRRTLVTITRDALFALPHRDDPNVLNTNAPLELLPLQAEEILPIVARKLAAGEKSDTGVLIDLGDLSIA